MHVREVSGGLLTYLTKFGLKDIEVVQRMILEDLDDSSGDDQPSFNLTRK